MTRLIDREADLKRREPEAKSSSETEGLFSIIRSFHRKITSDGAIIFHRFPTIRILEDCQREFELQKSKAILHISRLRTRSI